LSRRTSSGEALSLLLNDQFLQKLCMRPLRDFAGGEEDLTKCRWLQPLTCSRPRASTSPRFPLNLRLQGPVLLVAMCQGGWKAWRRRLSSNLRNFSRRMRWHLINIGRLQLDIELESDQHTVFMDEQGSCCEDNAASDVSLEEETISDISAEASDSLCYDTDGNVYGY